MDEPSIGLHQKDNIKLINALKRLRDLGNTVIVVEHDTETIENADHIIDLGPEAGINGGYIVAQGGLETILKIKIVLLETIYLKKKYSYSQQKKISKKWKIFRNIRCYR